MQASIQDKEKELLDMQSKNKELLSYIEKLKNCSQKQYAGKDISEVKKFPTLNTVMSGAEFSKFFGLELESLKVKEVKIGTSHTVMAQGQDPDEKGNGFDGLTEEEKVLSLLDKFCVGNYFYRDLTMVVDGLPKSYLMNQRRSELNDICHISPTQGEAEGAQVSFSELLKERIQDHVASHPNKIMDNVEVTISGDGPRMTKNSSFILLSFAFLHSGDDVMAAKGNHTIAVVRGKEDYNT